MVDARQLAERAQALKASGRIAEAILCHRQIVALTPRSATAEHNLAAALADAGRWREADHHIRQAFAKGVDAPESWLVRAHVMQSLSHFDEAERSFLEALRRRPAMYEAHQELVQLRWMRTGDVGAAMADLQRAIAAAPHDARLQVIKAKALEYAGRADEALALLAAAALEHPHDLLVAVTTAQLATEFGDPATALAHAERAMALAPHETVVALTLVGACLAIGRSEQASALVERVRIAQPLDQFAIALQATAWRILGDPRYRALHDYNSLVGVYTIDTPRGWSSTTAYLADLAAALKGVHGFATHPFNQSLRHGSQAPDILQSENPTIAALSEALDAPIRRHLAALGAGGDPVRARNLGGYAVQGMWSIRMSAGGFHINHVHPNGWLSSACYIELPQTLSDRQGWLKFGEPGVRTSPRLLAEHFVQPAPGRLALFPSYMWHGTVPFTDPATRLTVAFDMAPAPA